MKRSISFLYLLLLLALLGACVPTASTAPAAEPAMPTSSETVADPGAFPVTIDHKYGSVTLEAEPQRVISLGYGDEDEILALGIQPIAIRHWFGEPENGVWPWGQAALGDAKPQILAMGFGELNFEVIAALQPDLIIAIGAGLAAEEYNTLAQIAPTVVTLAGYDTQMPWQEKLRLVGQATGRLTKAAAVIADVETQIAAARAAHPEFMGKSVTIAEYLEPGSYYIFDADNVRYRVLNALGFVMPEAVLAMQADSNFNGTISAERLDLLEADLLIWGVADKAQQQELEASPLYQNLQVVAEDHDLFFTYNEEPNLISAAHAYGTALSIPYLLENLVPELSAALGGAPAAAAADTRCKEGFRFFDHALLVSDPVCIPAAPQRVLPLDMTALELMLMTEQTPLGTAQWILDELPLLLPEYADVVTPLPGLGYPADLEQVAALQPDLILAPADTIDVELAAQIAPVIVPDQSIYEDWKLGMEFWCAVMNVPELYAQLEATYDQRVAELQTALGDPAAWEVSVISASTYGIWLWMPDSSAGRILLDVGLSRPEGQALVGEDAIARYGEKQYIEISEERLDLVDGDAIFYFTYAAVDPDVAAEESAFLKTFNEKPLWQALNAVKADKAFFVGGYWWRSQTYLLANKVLDDLFANLTDTTASIPAWAGN
ncbi:MAG: iron-siderophore ABC transporter substrate-binding protein [Caldilineaceae bacterium]|nr:iron-siderophore ABC transporter substrate-binding protein [Caldilineaceae bacterium]